MNLIFLCVFNQEKYIDLLFLLLESISIYGNIEDDTHIMIYTCTKFMNRILSSHLYNKKIRFSINDTYNNLDTACRARLDLFSLPISEYSKILYLDTDILVKGDLNRVFALCTEDKIYAVQEGTIDSHFDFWGKTLFGDEVDNYEDKTAFTSGMLLFNNSQKMRTLFDTVKETIKNRGCVPFDQPYIVYNAFKMGLHDNKKITRYAVNTDMDRFVNTNIHTDTSIHHFPIFPIGTYSAKLLHMNIFLGRVKDYTIEDNINRTRLFIDMELMPIVEKCGEPLEGNIFTRHLTTEYNTDELLLHKVRNISSIAMNRDIRNVLEIGFNSGFSTLLMLFSNPYIKVKCYDSGEHSYVEPCFRRIKDIFGSRVELVLGNSAQTLKDENKTYDLVHIDGSHDTPIIEEDIINSYRCSRGGTIFIMNDYNFDNIHSLWDKYTRVYNMKPLDVKIRDTPYHDIRYITR